LQIFIEKLKSDDEYAAIVNLAAIESSKKTGKFPYLVIIDLLAK